MPFMQLGGGYYQARWLGAGAQRVGNLYAEIVPTKEGEPFQTVDYCTPGLTLQAVAPQSICRCLYQASNGDLWTCYGQQILWYSSTGRWTIVGTLQPSQTSDAVPRTTPVTMQDNGTTILIADGSPDGWTANVLTHDGFARIDPVANPNWYGADLLAFQDTFFIANKPGSPIFVVSDSEAATFTDALAFGSLTAQVTTLVAPVMLHRNLMLIGETATEYWINNGGDGTAVGSFPFSIYPDAFKNIGCGAKYSVAQTLNEVFWLARDKYGYNMVFRGAGLDSTRISTHAIETAISQYPTTSDAIGYCYQQLGHVYYVLTFPAANNYRGATFVYDATTELWHERYYTDENGIEHRHHGNCAAAAYGQVFVGDWRNGNLYTFDLDNFTDNGDTIVRRRGFPHQIDLDANRRIMFHQLIATMQVGSATEAGPPFTLIDASFDADTGTLLQNYTNINDRGAVFTNLGTINASIVNDQVTSLLPGTVLYQVDNTPTTPDYQLSYEVFPQSYSEVATDGSAIFVIGRANSSNHGYQALVGSDGTDYVLTLNVMGGAATSVVMGTLSAEFYMITLTMRSTSITLAAYREVDGLWLDHTGTWVGSPATAISIVDDTYTAPGNVLMGGVWE